MITKGQKINDRYEVIRSIGEGGMANVYLGYDTILDRNVAIKVLRGDLSNDEKFVRRFQREALSASSLAHPNIVEMYDVGEDDGMAHAHDSYIIHRDLKPQNIMIKDDGQIKITDFGIAMALNSTQLTQTNSVMGSVHYLPPEQASGKGSTIKSDIYSMGIIFYELLSGSLPFRGDNAVEIALKHMRDPLPSLREDNPSLPQSIENIIRRATAKNPKNRYDSARCMHEDLLTALDDERMDEEVYQYKYSENESDGRKLKKAASVDKNKVEDTVQLDDVKEIETTADITRKIESTEDILDDNDKKKKKAIIILTIIFSLIIIILVVIFFVVPKVNNKKAVIVPDCEDLKVSACEKKLQDKGFEVNTTIKTVASNKIKKNKVVKTGRSIKYGSKITIYKSTGEETYELEDYIGKNSIEIKTILETKYGLEVTIEKKDPTDNKEYDEDEIIGQSLAKGSEVKKGDSLILYVPNIAENFPDFVGEKWSLQDIQTFCDKNGLTLDTVEEQVSSNSGYQDGDIIRTNRTAGSKIYKGTTVKVTIAKVVKAKPTPTPTPTPTDNPTDKPTSDVDNNPTE